MPAKWIVLLLVWPMLSHAHPFSKQECTEGANYIHRVAHYRDHGITEEQLLGIFDKDVQESQAIPPDERWFMQDEEDRMFLRAAVVNVFRKPGVAEEQAAEFYHKCVVRSESPSNASGLRI